MNSLREALEALVEVVEAWKDHLPSAIRDGELSEALEKANSALALPRRNCDVGTAEEQMKRQHDTMCNTTKACPNSDWSCKKCFAEWAQMPYVAEGGAE